MRRVASGVRGAIGRRLPDLTAEQSIRLEQLRRENGRVLREREKAQQVS